MAPRRLLLKDDDIRNDLLMKERCFRQQVVFLMDYYDSGWKNSMILWMARAI